MTSPILSTKRVLVTGGNKGIGYALCKKLLEDHPEVHVILGSRNQARGEAAVQSLQSSMKGASGRVNMVIIDICSDDCVQNALESAGIDQQNQLYGIINNAGIGHGKGFRDTINTNYMGPRRVCDIFSPFLIRPNGRIVNVASASGPKFISKCKNLDLAQKLSNPLLLKENKEDDGLETLDELANSYLEMTDKEDDTYGLSKALLNACTVLYAAANPDLIVNSCTPGYILTDLTRGRGASNPPEMGTVCPIYLFLNEEMLKLPTGRYYGSDAICSPLGWYRDPGEPAYEGP